MNQKNENYWLLDAPVAKAIWHMAIPMMLGMSVNIIYNITDTFFIGRLNDTAALAAISLLFTIHDHFNGDRKSVWNGWKHFIFQIAGK